MQLGSEKDSGNGVEESRKNEKIHDNQLIEVDGTMLDSSWSTASISANEFINFMDTERVTDASTTAVVMKLLENPSKTSICSSMIESKVVNSESLIEILAERDSIVDAEANDNELMNGSSANHFNMEKKSSIIFHCENLELLNFSKSGIDEVNENILRSNSGIEPF